MPVFFIASAQVQSGRITVGAPLLEHLQKSLRVRPGEIIRFGDECRRRYHARVETVTARSLTATVMEEKTAPSPNGPPLILCLAILKGEKMDWVIQKSTELGVDSIRPIVTDRVIVKPKAGRQHDDRWQRIALEAAQQSERWEVPRIAPITTLQALCAERDGGTRLMLAERTTGMRWRDVAIIADRPVSMLVGPEGGWTESELNDALRAGWSPVSLGESILRAETAAIASVALLQSRLGRLG
ncbi:MAG TPA: RsmE family RNA methyltransferase [Nitrospirales bacterium]|nr:RsmE family RNA methyltransferase [Nitrospirales bacterium]